MTERLSDERLAKIERSIERAERIATDGIGSAVDAWVADLRDLLFDLRACRERAERAELRDGLRSIVEGAEYGMDRANKNEPGMLGALYLSLEIVARRARSLLAADDPAAPEQRP